MKKYLMFVLGGLMVGLVPLSAHAQTIQTLVVQVGALVNTLLPIVVAIALLVFFWGLVTYIRSAGDPEKAKEGKSIMTYGVIALFVMVSIWGIVKVVAADLGVQTGGTVPIPTITPARTGN